MIPHNQPSLGIEEQAAAARVIGSGWVAQGPEVDAFENDLCRFFGLPDGHALAVSSGSAALYLALWTLEGKGARVGVPVYSCAALRNAVGMVGGKSVYLDCAADSPNVNLTPVARQEIDILIAPSMFGIPVVLPEVRNYKVIEDLAQSIGALVDGKRIGLRGEIGICSFYATKMITSGGQGGALISRDKALIDKVRDYREFDYRDDAQLRFNFQMTDLQAAVGRVQLSRLPGFIEQRESWFSVYRQAGLNLIDDRTNGVQPVRYRAVMRCDNPERVISALAAEGIRAIVPIEKFELLGPPANYSSASVLANTTVSLPIYPALREEDVARISRIAREAE
ncbi:MAG: DegT/DnrJ/EryC1/StrS aminotransferase family protein [Zetaproteobacteria bacterium]|nr:DegT/DnrJ/EryC1/StrS aminotransferase family protein [Zetaproteobacteria bacterium]